MFNYVIEFAEHKGGRPDIIKVVSDDLLFSLKPYSYLYQDYLDGKKISFGIDGPYHKDTHKDTHKLDIYCLKDWGNLCPWILP